MGPIKSEAKSVRPRSIYKTAAVTGHFADGSFHYGNKTIH